MDHHVVALDVDDAETTQQQIVSERGRRIKAAAELGLVRSSRGRHWGLALGRRALVLRKDPSVVPSTLASAGEEAKQRETLEGEAEEEEKVTLLRQLVPGGGEMAVERLLEETADEEAKQRETLEGEAEEEEKVTLLRQLVPGGGEMAVERLLEETADYITALRAQVGVMHALACLLSGSGLDALPEKDGSSVTPEKPL